MKKILVPIDGSDASKKAAETAVSLARLDGSDITFLTVIEVSNDLAYTSGIYGYYSDNSEIRETLIKLKTESQRSMLEGIIQNLDCSDLHINKVLIVGAAHPQIVETAEEGKYDLIVMGHRGLNPIRRIFIGSVAKRVIEDAPCSVLIVK